VQDQIQKCADATEQHIDFLLEEEQEPFTTNEYYFQEYRGKFFTYYRGARQKDKSNFIKNLENRHADKGTMETLSEALAALTKMGLEHAHASSLANLLPPDPQEPAIGIMADVRAYFQGSSHIIFVCAHCPT
jgi:hypothetical protein